MQAGEQLLSLGCASRDRTGCASPANQHLRSRCPAARNSRAIDVSGQMAATVVSAIGTAAPGCQQVSGDLGPYFRQANKFGCLG